jgi:prepilin-type N-terminal cleavage/methylation domain-containing protein
MMKFNREEGLTLIELLITIAVIAIVAAISVPVITNVINDSNTNAAAAMQDQVNAFVAEGAATGTVTLNGRTLELRIDQNGDTTDGDEYLVKTFPVDAKFSVTGSGEGPFAVALVTN